MQNQERIESPESQERTESPERIESKIIKWPRERVLIENNI